MYRYLDNAQRGLRYVINLEIFTDPKKMRVLLQQRLPEFAENTLSISDCRIPRVRWSDKGGDKPTLQVCYWLDVEGAHTAIHGVQIVYANVYRQGCSQHAFERVRGVFLYKPRFGKALTHLLDLETIIWAFPNDPKLPHLPNVIDVNKVKHFLPYFRLPAGINGPNDIIDVSADVVRYHPEGRCTTRYQLCCGPQDTPRTIILFGKTFKATERSGKVIYSRLESIWTWSRQDPSTTHPK